MNTKDLYQEFILDHGTNPRNKFKLAVYNRNTVGFNRLCGDSVHIFINCNNQNIDEISFLGEGCAICIAATSVMTEILKGKSEQDLLSIIRFFLNFVKQSNIENSSALNVLDSNKLKAFQSIANFPMRIKCATLPWLTAEIAIQNKVKEINIEDYN